MARFDADFAIIGAGAAGLSVAVVTARLGLRTVLVERGRMGGECLNTGCVPSKALLAAAHAAQAVRAAVRFGVDAGAPIVDWPAVQAHVRGVIATIAPADSAERFRGLGATVLHVEASFVAPDTLRIGGQTLRARRIVVATGSRPAIPDIVGLEQTGFVTHETLFEIAEKPSHLLILGGGAIGLEMAQAHAGLGCRVTIIARGRIGGRDDPELVEILRARLLRDGVRIHENARVTGAAFGPVLMLATGERLVGSHLLVATGREASLESLNLEAGRVRVSERGVATDRGLRSVTNRRVFAVGDCADPAGIGPRYLTHSASHQAGVVIRRAVFRLPARVRAVMPRAIYTTPELAQVGLTEAEAAAAGLACQAARWRLAENDRAQTERDTEGLVKLVVGRGGRLLGAGIAAPHAGEMLGPWTLALDRGLRLGAMADLILPYPTYAEAAKRAAGSYFETSLFGPMSRRAVSWLRRLP